MAIAAVTAGITSNFLSGVAQLPVSGVEQIGAITPNPGVVEEQQTALEPDGRWHISGSRRSPSRITRSPWHRSFVTAEFRQAGLAGASAGSFPERD